jgi:hypothetical protein
MDVELLVIPDCPHASPVLRLVREALADLGLAGVQPRVSVVTNAAEPGLAASPTILIDGTDPFATPVPVSGLACRVYSGPSGLPSPESMRAALAEGLDR